VAVRPYGRTFSSCIQLCPVQGFEGVHEEEVRFLFHALKMVFGVKKVKRE
jgi:hypothetical protein